MSDWKPWTSVAEELVWCFLQEQRMEGETFLWNQHLPEADCWPDFRCDRLKLIIEIDGKQHRTDEHQISDRERDRRCKDAGWSVVRIEAWEVFHKTPAETRKRLARAVAIHRDIPEDIGDRQVNLAEREAARSECIDSPSEISAYTLEILDSEGFTECHGKWRELQKSGLGRAVPITTQNVRFFRRDGERPEYRLVIAHGSPFLPFFWYRKAWDDLVAAAERCGIYRLSLYAGLEEQATHHGCP